MTDTGPFRFRLISHASTKAKPMESKDTGT